MDPSARVFIGLPFCDCSQDNICNSAVPFQLTTLADANKYLEIPIMIETLLEEQDFSNFKALKIEHLSSQFEIRYQQQSLNIMSGKLL